MRAVTCSSDSRIRMNEIHIPVSTHSLSDFSFRHINPLFLPHIPICVEMSRFPVYGLHENYGSFRVLLPDCSQKRVKTFIHLTGSRI